jgi:hypothetical protein
MMDGYSFFVPDETPENQEAVYSDFARLCQREVHEPNLRIYSIVFVLHGIEWTATVGKKLQGIQKVSSHSNGRKVERLSTVSDPAIVLAIFQGNPFMVFTNHKRVKNVGSRWVNPFMAGQHKLVT